MGSVFSELGISSLRFLDCLLLLLSFFQSICLQHLQISSIPKIRLKWFFFQLYFNGLQVPTIPISHSIKINEAAVSAVELADWLAILVDKTFEIVGWSMLLLICTSFLLCRILLRRIYHFYHHEVAGFLLLRFVQYPKIHRCSTPYWSSH